MVMCPGPNIPPHAAMRDKLTKCNLTVGGTHSAHRVCCSNPAGFGKRIPLYPRDDWQLAQVPYGLRRQQQQSKKHNRYYDQSNFLFSTPCFRGHLHSSFAQGNTDTAGWASSASAQPNWMWECICGRWNTHTLQYKLPFLAQAARVGGNTLKDSRWWGCR